MRWAIEAVVLYLFGWTLCYALIMGTDFSFFAAYLVLAWTSPGEIPTFINVGAIFLALIGVVALAIRRKRAQVVESSQEGLR